MKAIKQIVCAVGVVCAGAAQAGLPTSVWFDGYCDGFSNITDQGDGVVTGTYDLSNCDGFSDTLLSVGTKAHNTAGTVMYTGIDYADASFSHKGWATLYRISENGKFTVYFPEGDSLSGTWTEGSKRVVRSGAQPVGAAAR